MSWRDDAKEMDYETFKIAHAHIFPDEWEMREMYKEATGKDWDEKPKSKKFFKNIEPEETKDVAE